MTSVSSSLMSLGLQCGWPSMGVSNGVSPLSVRNPMGAEVDYTTNNYACTNADYFSQPLKLSSPIGQTYTQQPSSAFRPNQYSPQAYFPPAKPQMARVNTFAGPPANLPYNSPQQRCPSYMNTQFVPNVPPATNQIDGSKLHEWQEGFRALLPNVNVRFVPDLSAAGMSIFSLYDLTFLHAQHALVLNI